MASSTGKQITNNTHIAQYLRIISNQTMTFGGIKEYNLKIFSTKNHAENEACRLLPDHFCCFFKTLYEVKANDRLLSFNSLWLYLTWAYNENKLYKFSN